MRAGIRLGVDVGSVRVGLAASDPGGILATPIQTLERDLKSGADQGAIAAVVLQRGVLEVVVGLGLVVGTGAVATSVLWPMVTSLTASNDYTGGGHGVVPVVVHDGDASRTIGAVLEKAG